MAKQTEVKTNLFEELSDEQLEIVVGGGGGCDPSPCGSLPSIGLPPVSVGVCIGVSTGSHC